MSLANRIMRMAKRSAVWLLSVERLLRNRRDVRGRSRAPGRTAPAGVSKNYASHADERTIRKIAEEQDGGISSAASRAAYEQGENPGGLHHGGTPAQPAPHRGDPSVEDGADESQRTR